MLKDVSTNTKKAIAREFLLLLAVFAIGLVTYLAVYPHNYYKQYKANKLNSEILEKTKLRDSLRKQNLGEQPDYELWKGLKQEGYPSDYKRFRVVMSDKNKRDSLYNLVKQQQLYSKSRNDFESQFFAESYYSKKGEPAAISTIVSEQSTNNSHEDVIRFIRDKYYKDKTFEEISAFIMKDSSSFNKALNVVYSDSYSNNVEYPNFEDFKLKYYQLKGNPFKKAGGKIENNDPINDLWKMLKSDNIPVSDNLDEFRSDMQDPSMRKELYNYLYDKRLYRKKFNDFENQYPTLEQTKATSPNDLKWTNKNNQDILLETLQKQIDSISLLKDRVLSEKLTTETQYIEDHKKVNTIYSQQIQISFKLFIIALCLIFGVRYIYHAIKWSIITLKQ